MEQMCLFTDEEMKAMLPKKHIKKLYCTVEAPDGHTWVQELERKPGLTPWQTAIKYRNEGLGRGYWICSVWLS